MFVRVLSTVAGVAVVAVGAVGVVAAPAAALGVVAFGGFVGVVVGIHAEIRSATGGGPPAAGFGRRAGVLAGATTVAGLLALTGLVTLLGPTSGLVILTLLATVVLVWLWLRPGRPPSRIGDTGAPRVARRPERAITPLPPQLAPAALSTQELCLAWRRSYVALLDVPAGPARCEVIRLRGRLLDELERRDPAGFVRWLETGAHEGSDPSRYLATDQ